MASGAEALLPAIMGGFKRQAQAQPAGGGLGDLMGSLLGGGGAASAGGAMPRNAAPGLGSLLDLNGDGNRLDDILRMAGKTMR